MQPLKLTQDLKTIAFAGNFYLPNQQTCADELSNEVPLKIQFNE